MRALLLFAVLVAAACQTGPFRNTLRPVAADPDSLYWKAVAQLDAANTSGSTDSAIHFLERYLADGQVQPHRREALVFRQLARDAMLLARVQAALTQQQKPDTVRIRTEPRGRDEEALKEIQRLKDELAKANEELERIRKRLANPKPPASDTL